jgi:hypothetical protein
VRQQRLARRMITRSDNAATETLLAQVGRDEVRRVAGLAGMADTEIDDTRWWGLWRTTPADLGRCAEFCQRSASVGPRPGDIGQLVSLTN